MSYFEDYIADGLMCQECGVLIDKTEPGYPRSCDDCTPETLSNSNSSGNKTVPMSSDIKKLKEGKPDE